MDLGLNHYSYDEHAITLENEYLSCVRSSGSSSSKEEAPHQLLELHTNCNYMRPIIHRAFALHANVLPLRLPHDLRKPTLQWDEYENIDWKAVLRGELVANSYCIRKGLSRKAQLSIYLQKYISKRPRSILEKALPRTIIVDTWDAFSNSSSLGFARMNFRDRLNACLWEVREVFEEEGGVWIMKPSATNKGAEVNVIDSFEKFQEIVFEWTDIREWVVQSYIDRPLLVKGRKFHLRAYVLAVGSLKVYLFKEVLVLTAMESYKADDVHNHWSHITNTAHQQAHPDFVEEECVFTMDDLPKTLSEQGISSPEDKVKDIFSQMERITADMFDAYRGEFSIFQPLPNCFELYGVDFLVDEDFNVWLLEANCGPDFKNTGGRLHRVISDLVTDTIEVAVYPLVFGEQSANARAIGGGSEYLGKFSKVYDESWGAATRSAPSMAFHD